MTYSPAALFAPSKVLALAQLTSTALARLLSLDLARRLQQLLLFVLVLRPTRGSQLGLQAWHC